MLSVQITNAKGETREFPMFVNQWACPQFGEKASLEIDMHVGIDCRVIPEFIEIAIYEGAAVYNLADTSKDADDWEKIAYLTLLNGKKCTANQVYEYCENELSKGSDHAQN